ncbi:aKG-HExxH-type peptide beta-hydroxylase [Paludibacterium purpuratum]|uniref:HEXXH motif-containing protein n=1 Tax=Paludibacterium purpuratum TaxID=1144873 RepID=A0A4R7BC96_9NEIS|nr:HEXXH motif-containing putative peptide modification protein [Paludibacterium purpuratum]TDR82680.1 HEXXH motif-containing protein [Paludibacterium purpuratum]
MTMHNDAIDPRYRQFACPKIAFDPVLFEAVVLFHAQAVVDMFLQRRAALLAERSVGVIPLIERWRQRSQCGSLDAGLAWDMAFGRVQWALETDEVDAGDVALHLALHLTSHGLPGDWRGSLSEAGMMRWGNWLLPVEGEVSVVSDGGQASVSFVDFARGAPSTLSFYADEHGWQCDQPEALLRVGIHQSILLLPEFAIRGQLTLEDQFGSIVGYPEPDAGMADTLARALDLLARYAPDYLIWVERVIRGAVICQCKETRTRSSTWSEAPGIILLSHTTDVATMAEMLVHEASHQYYHVVGRVGRVDDGSDRQLYYSPAVARERPLARVLIAYHAFANILLMYRDFRQNGLAMTGTTGWWHTAERMEADVGVLAAPLCDNPALTAYGRALFEPLHQRVHAVAAIDG